MTTPSGIYSHIDDIAYHADRGSLSSSGAQLLVPPSTPARFRYLMDNPPKPKREYDFGHCAHRKVLGKGADIKVLDPTVHGLTADGKRSEKPRSTAMWKAAEADAWKRRQVPMSTTEDAIAIKMAAVVMAHETAAPLFADGQAEMSMYITDPPTGVQLRARPDWMTEIDGRIWLIDYKTSTTAHPQTFARKVADFGYHMQGAWYRRVAILLELDPDPAFVFVVQEKEPPFLVSVVEWGPDDLAEGAALNREAIDLYAHCSDHDEWTGYPPGIHSIHLPPWKIRNQPTLNDLMENQ